MRKSGCLFLVMIVRMHYLIHYTGMYVLWHVWVVDENGKSLFLFMPLFLVPRPVLTGYDGIVCVFLWYF